jgi:hypothetical protein
MNDIERMIAAIIRPGPSRSFDERVQTLLAPPEPIRPRKPRWRVAMDWLGTAACVGLVGFYVGRVSVGVQPISAPVTTIAPPSNSPSQSLPSPATIVNIPLGDDQLAALFVRSSPREGLLGKGPFTVEVSTSP